MAHVVEAISVYGVGLGFAYWVWWLVAFACVSTLSLALMDKTKSLAKRVVEEAPRVKKAIGHKKAKPTKEKIESSKKGESSKRGEGMRKKTKSISVGCQNLKIGSSRVNVLWSVRVCQTSYKWLSVTTASNNFMNEWIPITRRW